jgi:hypothetical protein
MDQMMINKNRVNEQVMKVLLKHGAAHTEFIKCDDDGKIYFRNIIKSWWSPTLLKWLMPHLISTFR